MGSPKAPYIAEAGELSWGEQPHNTGKEDNPTHPLWGDPDPYLHGSKGKAGGNVAGNIHQPQPQHLQCVYVCVGDPMETGAQTAPALLPQPRRSLPFQWGFFRLIQT